MRILISSEIFRKLRIQESDDSNGKFQSRLEEGVKY